MLFRVKQERLIDLDSAGIESFLADENMARVEWPITRGMKLQVGADDAEAAIALLEQSPADDSND